MAAAARQLMRRGVAHYERANLRYPMVRAPPRSTRPSSQMMLTLSDRKMDPYVSELLKKNTGIHTKFLYLELGIFATNQSSAQLCQWSESTWAVATAALPPY